MKRPPGPSDWLFGLRLVRQATRDPLRFFGDTARRYGDFSCVRFGPYLDPPAVGVFVRQAISDVELGGYTLPRGSLVRAFSYLVHCDPRWFPDPERFDPERFAPDAAVKLPPFAYFPFGGGPRVCIGNTFAMTEMILVTAAILPRFQLRLAPGQARPVPQVGMSLRPQGGLRMRARRQERQVTA